MPKFFNAPFYSDSQIEAMYEKDMVFPFSCKNMRYDSVKRQYIPTQELLLKHGIDINNFLDRTGDDAPQNINNELEFISDQVYSYINKNSGSDFETLKWIVAKGYRRGMSPFRFRLLFEEMLWKQARFYLSNDDPTKSIGMDIEQKQYLSKSVFINEDRHIDPKVKIMLMDLGLAWVGSYDDYFCGLVQKEDW